MNYKILTILLFIITGSINFSFCQKNAIDSVEYQGEYYYLFTPYSDNALNMWNRWEIDDTKELYNYSENEYLPEGKWIQFFEIKKHIPAKIFYLKNDTLNGYYKGFNNYGVIDEEGLYENGERMGSWIYRYDDGSFMAQGEKRIRVAENGYVFNINIGEWKWFYNDGSLKRVEHYNEQGEKVGVWKYYFENGQLKREENYVNDDLEGFVTDYHPNGQLKSQLFYIRVNDYFTEIKDSVYSFFYVNGQLNERGYFKKGMRYGLWESWYENGQLKSKGNYIYKTYTYCGVVPFDVNYLLKDGKWTYWHSNGKKMAEGEYDFGTTNIGTNCEGGADITTFYTNSDWKFWDENGKKVNKGYLLKKNVWKEDRQPMDNQHYMFWHIDEDNWEDFIPPGM